MREKYIEEEFRRYFVFGANDAKGLVDVSDGDRDIVSGVSVADAKRLIADRDHIVSALVHICFAWDASDNEAYIEYWYGDQRQNDAEQAANRWGTKGPLSRAREKMWKECALELERDALMEQLADAGRFPVNSDARDSYNGLVQWIHSLHLPDEFFEEDLPPDSPMTRDRAIGMVYDIWRALEKAQQRYELIRRECVALHGGRQGDVPVLHDGIVFPTIADNRETATCPYCRMSYGLARTAIEVTQRATCRHCGSDNFRVMQSSGEWYINSPDDHADESLRCTHCSECGGLLACDHPLAWWTDTAWRFDTNDGMKGTQIFTARRAGENCRMEIFLPALTPAERMITIRY